MNFITKSPNRYYFLALAVVIIDQTVKFLVKFNMALNESFPLIGDWFKIHFTENKGAAFGLTLDDLIGAMPEVTAKLILSGFSVIAVIAIIYFLSQAAKTPTKLPWFVALILGGALGNIIDRMLYGVLWAEMNVYDGGFMMGRVVDMFYLDIWQGFVPNWVPIWGGGYMSLWPIFNVADAAISIGILSIIFFQKRFLKGLGKDIGESSEENIHPDKETHSKSKASSVDPESEKAVIEGKEHDTEDEVQELSNTLKNPE